MTMLDTIVVHLIAAAAADYLDSYWSWVQADRSVDAGEWSDAARGLPPIEVIAAHHVMQDSGLWRSERFASS